MSTATASAKHTKVFHPYSLIAPLATASKVLDEKITWNAFDIAQRWFLTNFLTRGFPNASGIPEILSRFSGSADELNAFMYSQSVDTDFTHLSRPEFGIASVFRYYTSLKSAGTAVEITGTDGKKYPGVDLPRHSVSFLRSPAFQNAIVELTAANGDLIYLTCVNQQITGNDLGTIGQILLASMSPLPTNFSGVQFPTVDMNVDPDITFLENLYGTRENTEEVLAVISQAKQHTAFSLDETGATPRDLLAGNVQKSDTRFLINKPFIVMVRRAGLMLPLFIGLISPEHWKKPNRKN